MTEAPKPGASKAFGPFSALLVVLSLFMLFGPLVGQIGFGGGAYRFGFSAVLVVSLLVARENRKIFLFSILFVVVNLIDKWFTAFEMNITAEIFSLGTGIGYLWFLIWTLVRRLVQRPEATLDTVLGGINVYLIIALAFMLTHLLVERVAPGSYETRGVSVTEWVTQAPLPEGGDDPFRHEGATGNVRNTTTFLYFSFTTLTTLGYGDIVPAKPLAQMLCSAEAVIGQMFVAIFIGGLVAQHIGSRQEQHRNGS